MVAYIAQASQASQPASRQAVPGSQAARPKTLIIARKPTGNEISTNPRFDATELFYNH